MSISLIIGNKNYSSWSMRAWLLLKFIEVPFEEISIDLYTAHSRDEVKNLGGQTGLVPVLKDNGVDIWDTLAITEHLYETYHMIWPKLMPQRARARSICGEVHASMHYLRDAMPVNIRARYQLKQITQNVKNDIHRVCEIWQDCTEASAGPWLFDEFSAADIMFAPMATRFQTYNVQLSGIAKEYQHRILTHPLVEEWLALGMQEKTIIKRFEDNM